MANFTHLHLHSEYSLLDGLSKLSDLVPHVKELGMDSVALTDHGVMYGAFEFWNKCTEYDIKPIIGVEAYIAPRTRFDKVPKVDNYPYHIVLLAKNFDGYKNLIKLVSASHLEGFYYKPRIDKELISKYGKNIIATSACIGGVVNNQLLYKQEKEAQNWANFLAEHFDEFYIEIQRNGIKEAEQLIDKQIKLARDMKLPLVATCDAHYLKKEHGFMQEVLWAISDGKKLDDDTRRKASSYEFYVKSPEEMEELFKDIPEAIENTIKISEKIEKYTITFDRIQPEYQKKTSVKTAQKILRELAYEGAKKRYGKIDKKLEERIDYELKIIHDKGYDDYFLVVYDYINWARKQGIIVGPGRGSSAGSVVAYSLEITNLDPFKFELYFERFLNPERPSPPDIDTDFQDDRRDELFEYMSQTYGAENTSFIGTFGRMKTRAAIRDIARVMDIDLEIADKLSKMVDVKFGRVTLIEDMIKTNDEFKETIESSPELKELVKYVRLVEGIARHVSTHACGYLVTPHPITDYVPIQKESRGGNRIITQIEGYSLEPLGLMKFDFLGLKNLTIIKNTINLIEKAKKIKINIDDIPLNDKETYKLFQKAETTAVFQFESEGIKKYLKELKPSEFEDLIFLCAAYRPGPMKYIPDYIERKFSRQEVDYPHPDLIPILSNTYGFAIYQEQVLRIAVAMAGYTLGEADILRRAMGKKKPEIMKAEKEKFVAGCLKKGYSNKLADKLFSYIEPFADYGFVRAHAACYALIAYQTAYLKAHYPEEFIAGLMQTDLDTSDKLTRDILESERMKINVLPPNINKSFCEFKIESESSIRFGLAGIKNVGEKIVEKIIEERIKNGEFKNLDELITRVGTENLNKKTLECLIKVGTMDQFGKRSALLEIMSIVFDRVSKIEQSYKGGQSGLFDQEDKGTSINTTPLPQVEEEDEMTRLEWEKELLGTYITTHPLKKYTDYFGEEIITVPQAREKSDNSSIKVGGIISRYKEILTRKNNKKMAFINIEYYHEELEGVVFNSIYEKTKDKLQVFKPFVFEGKISSKDGKKSLIVDDISSFSKFQYIKFKPKIIQLDISKEKDPTKLKILKQTIADNPGNVKVILFYSDTSGIKSKFELKNGINLTKSVENLISEYMIRI